MKNILFVDDEPRILEVLEKLMQLRNADWHMRFAVGGEAALAALKEEPFDFIITDMRMPGMDGAALLKHVHAEYPHIVRFILTGHTEIEDAFRAAPVAHEFLTKPCDPAMIEQAVKRSCRLQELIGDKGVRETVGRIQRLPSTPKIFSALTRALADPDASASDMARIIEKDIAISAKLLHLVNSAFFRVAKQIVGVEYAIVYLGFNIVKGLVLSTEVFEACKIDLPGFNIAAHQRHGILTGSIAAELMIQKRDKEDAFMAGLLHDIGKLILAQELPERYARVHHEMCHTARPMHAVEQEMFEVTHAELGGYLLSLWGFSNPIVEAVTNHHEPKRSTGEAFDTLAAVHISNFVANEELAMQSNGSAKATIDFEYLDKLSIRNKLVPARKIAADQAKSILGGPNGNSQSYTPLARRR